MIIILFPEQDEVDETQLYSLARVSEWLAARTDGKIALLLPATYRNHSALDSISYGAITLTSFKTKKEAKEKRLEGDSRETPDDVSPKPSTPSAWIFPFLGKPHPCSPGEQIVAQLISTEKLLKNLFLYNHLIRGCRGGAHICDLVWPNGRLVIEIDGYRFHSSSEAFRADRKRDRELLLSGYRVMRLSHSEVIDDPRQAVKPRREISGRA